MNTLRAPRQDLVDALRGFALLGILVVNIASFASTWYGAGVPDPLGFSPLQRGASFVRALLFESKFYLLFSFLFGYSFLLQMQAAQSAGARFAPRMRRRLVALWVLGVAHGVLLYYGDILTTYAVLGAVLLALRARGSVLLLRWAVALVLAPALLWAAVGYGLSLLQVPTDLRGAYAEGAAALAAYRGTPASTIAQNLHELSRLWWVAATVQAPSALAMLLAGFVAARQALLADVASHRTLLRRLLFVGLAVGVPGAVFYAWSALRPGGGLRELHALAASLMTAPFLTAAYGAGLLLWFDGSARGAALARWLAPAGRMALTNYLTQSLMCAWLFHAWGLRWIGSVSPAASMAIAFAIFGLQLAWSRWWLGRFAYGPVEWGLRAVTNLALPAWRR